MDAFLWGFLIVSFALIGVGCACGGFVIIDKTDAKNACIGAIGGAIFGAIFCAIGGAIISAL